MLIPPPQIPVEGADHEFLKIPERVEESAPERIVCWLHKHLK